MNHVRGRVTIRGTRMGVSGLLVRVVAAPHNSATDPSRLERSVGSTITHEGEFHISFEDEAFRRGTDDKSRPDLVVSVFAPESPGATPEKRLLFGSDVRRAASRDESFPIQLDTSLLERLRVPIPVARPAVGDDPRSVGKKARELRGWKREVARELREAVKEDVDNARRLDAAADAAVREPVLRHLTGLRPDSPAWARFVKPGEDAATKAREVQQRQLRRLAGIAEAQPDGDPLHGDLPVRTLYLALSQEEYTALHHNGQLLRARVEAMLRGTNAAGTTLLRTDPLARACADRARPSLPAQPMTPATPTDGSAQDTDTPADPLDVNAKLAHLVRDMQSPESMGVPEASRPDQESVGIAIGKLSLSRGPADVPALYDFHNLQIAFDHVWEDFRAEAAIEAAKVLYKQVDDAGGDSVGALQGAGDPLRALQREGQVARVFGNTTDIFDQHGGDLFGGSNDPYPDPWGGGGGGGGGGRPDLSGFRPVNGPNEFSHGSDDDNSGDDDGTQYPGTIFAVGTVNFGLLVTYRQKWEPVTYQVGRLAKTLTLAPKETVSYSVRQVVKTSLTRDDMTTSRQTRKEDADDTYRDEAEIVARAEAKTNFSLVNTGTAKTQLGEGVGFDATTTSTLGRDAGSSSQETKKSFREAARKSAQEYYDERQMKVVSADTSESETTEKREISNPNDELTVTYLFYELQRRFRVSERLHRVIPVVLVAQVVPSPSEITQAWLLRHDWIIRRVLLDESFLPALVYLATRARGDEVGLGELKNNVVALRKAIEEHELELANLRTQMSTRYGALEAALEDLAEAEREESGEGVGTKILDFVTGDEDLQPDTARQLESTARDAFDRVAREVRDATVRLDREVTALQAATEAYTRLLTETANQKVQIDRLVNHVRDNLLHYMQAIWGHEHADQRLMRYHKVEAPRLRPVDKQYALEAMPADGEWPLGMTPTPGKTLYKVTVTIRVSADLSAEDETATLAELVDLDRPLGFKCNYIIFPLKESNALTDFMIAPYLDAELGLRDPDPTGNWTLDEFRQYVECLKTKEGFDYEAVKNQLEQQLQALLMDPVRDGEEMIVPTDSLYIEALVGTHPLIEDFKLRHRALDVMKVKAEVRGVELENLRKAARLIAGEREDPDIERKIVIEGVASVVVPPIDL